MSDWKQKIEASIAELQHEGWYATDNTDAATIAATLQALLDEIESLKNIHVNIFLQKKAEIERLQATVEHLQDLCKEKHDTMIACMNEALTLRAALERIERIVLGTPDQFRQIAREALNENPEK